MDGAGCEFRIFSTFKLHLGRIERSGIYGGNNRSIWDLYITFLLLLRGLGHMSSIYSGNDLGLWIVLRLNIDRLILLLKNMG